MAENGTKQGDEVIVIAGKEKRKRVRLFQLQKEAACCR